MLQAFVITLREGLEAFLIIGISLAYLRKSGRQELISAVHWGIGLSVLLSIGAAYLFQQASNQALWEGVLAHRRRHFRRDADRAHVAHREKDQERDRRTSSGLSGEDRHVPRGSACSSLRC